MKHAVRTTRVQKPCLVITTLHQTSMPISFGLVHMKTTNKTHHIDRSTLTDSIKAGGVDFFSRVGKGKLLESQFIEKGQGCGHGDIKWECKELNIKRCHDQT
ncbi:hypothetical protein SADUNF_Sadunf08G0090800 [Salix dunnii]|uniref:Uncharacterized protein n=1 Tax=Salix dunnii TaxID=1413687 RepID=A0A835N1A9_9ROSI|nr:hypothetical protein SADUNF_Sadunf08G0090800 [Salix dunnii]